MTNAGDYLTAAAAILMRNEASQWSTIDDVRSAVESFYKISITPQQADYLVFLLERSNLLRVTRDRYAGTYVTPPPSGAILLRIETLRGERSTPDGLGYVLRGGVPLVSRALQNGEFWDDLNSEIDAHGNNDFDGASVTTEIPASDRVVTLSHNQFNEIDEPTGALLKELERDNGIPDQPGLKERLMGQISAGRELLRAGEFSLEIFRLTMLTGLTELKDKYGDHAIGAAASALLTLILHILGLPGF